MNLTALYRDHPDLAEMLGPHVHLVSCPDCDYHFPASEMYFVDSKQVCGFCFDGRQDAAWADWCDRLAKESV